MRCSSETKTWRLLRVLFLRLGSVSVRPEQTGRHTKHAAVPRLTSAADSGGAVKKRAVADHRSMIGHDLAP